MDIRFAASRSPQADTLVYAVKTGGLELLPAAAGDMAGDMAGAAALARFAGECGGAVETFATIDGQARRILLLGVGGASEADMEKAGAALTGKLLTSGAKSASVSFEAAGPVTAEGVVRFALGAELRSWRIDKYRTKLTDKQKPTLDTVEIVSGADCAELWTRSAAVAEGVKFTRELVAEPANVIYPEARHGRAARRRAGLGAQTAPAGDGMERRPGGESQPLVLRRQGRDFDTGGISIKPAAGMEDMKWDMGGAGAVAGTMLRWPAAQGQGQRRRHLRPGRKHARRQCPAPRRCRHLDVGPDHRGDQHRRRRPSRAVRCADLGAADLQAAASIDLATLTGAIIISLGMNMRAVFQRRWLAAKLTAAGKASGDKLWRLPMGPPMTS
jgi:leucyl aminopeptidase